MNRIAAVAGITVVLSGCGFQAGKKERALPTDTEVLKMVPPGVTVELDVPYREGHEMWKVDLAMPEARGESPRPAILFIHGGGFRNGDKRAGMFLTGPLDFASKGYVCATVNYRLLKHAPFPACVEDVANAVRWLRANAEKYNVDPERIGAFGNSAGGHLVCMLGVLTKEDGLEGDGPYQEYSSRVNAVCASATPANFPDWPGGLDQFKDRGGLLEGETRSIEERAAWASPITYVSEGMAPVLLIHGTSDGTVDYSQATSFLEAAKEAGAKDVNLLTLEGAGHGGFSQERKVTHPAMEKFFERTIGK